MPEQFDSQAKPLTDDFKVNTFSAFNQQRSQVAMTPAGDFDIVWESFQDQASWDPTGSTPACRQLRHLCPALCQIFANHVDASLGPNGEIGSEIRLNTDH